MGQTFSVAPVCSHTSCHGTMFEWCSIQVTSTSSPGAERAAAPRLRDEVDALGAALGEDDLALVGGVDERRAPSRACLRRPPSRARSAGASRGGCSRCRAGSSDRARRGPARGFCVVFALSRYTSGLPCTRSARMGKSSRSLRRRRRRQWRQRVSSCPPTAAFCLRVGRGFSSANRLTPRPSESAPAASRPAARAAARTPRGSTMSPANARISSARASSARDAARLQVEQRVARRADRRSPRACTSRRRRRSRAAAWC